MCGTALFPCSNASSPQRPFTVSFKIMVKQHNYFYSSEGGWEMACTWEVDVSVSGLNTWNLCLSNNSIMSGSTVLCMQVWSQEISLFAMASIFCIRAYSRRKKYVFLLLIIVPGVCDLQLALLQGYFTLHPLGAPLSKKQQVLKGIGSSLLLASGVSWAADVLHFKIFVGLIVSLQEPPE